MMPITIRASRAIAAAGLAAGLISALALAPGYAAEAAPPPLSTPHEEVAQGMAKHFQAHLDELGARLQIKASQEPAWQAFSGALRDVMTAHLAQAPAAAGAPDADAASLARQHAERAADHAQKLARLADATAKLQQSLSADQRLVLNEVARHFAQEQYAHGPMHGRGYGHWGPHCDGADGGDGRGPWEHRPWQRDRGPDAGQMPAPPGTPN